MLYRRNGKERLPRTPLCDFCATPHPRWAFPADDCQLVVLPDGRPQMSEGAWAACDECREAIRANDRTRLERRAIRMMRTEIGPLHSVHIIGIRRCHTAFFSARLGDEFPFARAA